MEGTPTQHAEERRRGKAAPRGSKCRAGTRGSLARTPVDDRRRTTGGAVAVALGGAAWRAKERGRAGAVEQQEQRDTGGLRAEVGAARTPARRCGCGESPWSSSVRRRRGATVAPAVAFLGFQGMVMASTCACFKADDPWTKRGRATGGTAGDQTGSKHHTLVQGWPRRHMQQQTATRAAARAEHGNVRYSGNIDSGTALHCWQTIGGAVVTNHIAAGRYRTCSHHPCKLVKSHPGAGR
ncbi:unnamed protein product [Miscanthus lutarioriparius]|uniref:Uncharacterized protein n=1 Tax=Miscanthus lutarioriparius TaxID=422564 RepID=A0A811NE20_9POAL|nr:unnamed protein product [Miscanthus lutarioriparius]